MFKDYLKIAFRNLLRNKTISFINIGGLAIGMTCVILITKWVLFANFIAWPIACYAMNQWLQNFAYRIDMTIWPFLWASLATLMIALLTVSWQAIRAATANPVEALRYE
jgi:putative ABC transport system permease protein